MFTTCISLGHPEFLPADKHEEFSNELLCLGATAHYVTMTPSVRLGHPEFVPGDKQRELTKEPLFLSSPHTSHPLFHWATQDLSLWTIRKNSQINYCFSRVLIYINMTPTIHLGHPEYLSLQDKQKELTI